MEQILQAVEVSKVYGSGETAVRALNGVDFAAARGEFVAIMGPSGSGKSTLLAILGGLEPPSAGEVLVGGQSLSGLSETALAHIRRDRIGFVFQSFHLVSVLTAAENIALPLLLAGRRGKMVEARVQAVIEQVGLADRARHRPAELSGGQQQRVAIARALVAEPAILLADEPTGNLDSRSADEVMQILRHAVHSHGQTVVLITHDRGVAAWADRILYMHDGELTDQAAGRGGKRQ